MTQPQPPPPPPVPAVDPGRDRIGIVNEEENQIRVGLQLRDVAKQIMIPVNVSPQDLLMGLGPNAGSPPPAIRRKN